MGSFNVCFGIDDDPFYEETVTCLCQEIRGGSVVPLLGAGASFDKPSQLPVADALRAPLIDCLLRASTDIKFAEKVLKDARLERLLDALLKTHGRSALEYLDVLDSDRWNENHGTIAALAKAG